MLRSRDGIGRWRNHGCNPLGDDDLLRGLFLFPNPSTHAPSQPYRISLSTMAAIRSIVKSFIFRSVLSFLAGFFFASILFVPRPVESRTLPEVVGLDSLSERPFAELPARTSVAPRRTSFGGVPVIRQH